MTDSQIQRIKQRYSIMGNCDALNRALDTALKIAPVDLSVLIIGENGVGKEIFPRIIHDNSKRKSKNYFAINCGAIPEGTIDSELFGHVEGAYTGAVGAREGYFASANGGTLFLDEVGELPLATQARLLRVLETGEYIPVGSSEVRKTNVRIVAATNVNMEKAIADGKFREDLYYRLNCVSISIPPLRHRGNDVISLFRYFAMEMQERYGIPPLRLTPEAEAQLLNYSWPGNVRQLRNIVTNMSITAEERTITPEILLNYVPSERHKGELMATGNQSSHFQLDNTTIIAMLLQLRKEVDELKRIVNNNNTLPPANFHPTVIDNVVTQAGKNKILDLGDYEEFIPEESEHEKPTGSLSSLSKELIRKTLHDTNNNRKIAAQILGISERTLYRKIKEYGLE